MKNIPKLLVILILICYNSDKISEKSIDLNNKAVHSLRSDKYYEALKYSEEAILADNKNYQAYPIKAQVLIKQNRFHEAEETIQKQLKIKHDFAEGWTFKGLINSLKGDQIQDFERRSVQLFENKWKNNIHAYQAMIL
ncbi:tetratricopeptide repeat protein [Chryseobacterium taichungense]|uniref:tetratricopeptide repeat protein n=1 Tax=Chryseobacterium taichungense TaxID=295069 RepID=UPI0028AD5C2F|nr:tetratricopeptide repeat protein [Chryseobacterium taichungense]